MKEDKADMDISDLFRKLEGAEVDPSPATGSILMRKLAVREFLRFNPSRFNIYYAGLVAAFTAAALYLVLGAGAAADNGDSSFLPLPAEKSDTLVIQSGKILSLTAAADKLESVEVQVHNKPGKVGPEPGKTSVSYEVAETTDKQSFQPSVTPENRVLASPALYKTDPAAAGLRPGSSIPGMYIGTSASSGCVPLKVRFSVRAAGADSCVWSFGDGGRSFELETEWTYRNEGEFRVGLTLFFRDGTTRTEQELISVFGKPAAHFEISPVNPVIPDDEIRFVNYSSGAVSYKWDFGDGGSSGLFAPAYRYRSFGTYDITLIATSDRGCSDTLVVRDAFGETGYFIDFPNAFIPNAGGPSDGHYSWSSDEMAHIFHPEYSGVAEFSLKIFSKAGILVFETDDIHTGWDGYFKGRLSSPGVYVWKVAGAFANGEPFTRTGDLILIRNEF